MIRKSEDIAKAEAERRSKDLYKVYNPTTQDMQVVLNARVSPEYWTIHARKEEIVPWYVAEIYSEKMYDQIVYSKTEKLTIEENEKRMDKGFPKMDYHTEQMRMESRNLKNMSAKKDQIMKILIKGLYKEYGVNDGTEAYNKEYDRQNIETESIVDEVLGLAPKKTTIPTAPLSNASENGSSEDLGSENAQLNAVAQPTRRQLEEEAKALDIDTSKMRNKDEIMTAIGEKKKNTILP